MKSRETLWALSRLNPAAAAAAVMLCFLIAVSLLADVIATHDPLAQDVEARLKPPGTGHLFGTDGFGRDVFSRVIIGSRMSLYVGFLAVGISAVVGTGVGVASAYRGGVFDLIVQRLVDVLLGFPYLVLAVIIIVAMQPSPTSVALAVSLPLCFQVMRVARASALTVRKELYIAAAELTGVGFCNILRKHLLPNSMSPILAQVTGYFGTAIIAETTLSFLGLGVPPPYPSWGRMLQEGASRFYETAPWLTVFPGIAVSITVISFVLLSDGIRDLIDPRADGTGRNRRKQ